MTPLACPHCRGQTLYLPEYAGQVVACPHCGGHMLMTLPESPAEAQPAAKQVPLKTTAAAQAMPQLSSPAVNGKREATSRSNAPVIVLLAVLGVAGVGACLLMAAVGGYFLLAHSDAAAVAENAQPVADKAPTAMEILAEFPPAAAGPVVPAPVVQGNESPADPFAAAETEELSPQQFLTNPDFGVSGGNETLSSPAVTGAEVAPAVSTSPSPISPQPASLQQVAKQAELPTLASAAAEEVTPLGVAQPAEVRLRLISTAADIPDQAAFVALRSEDDPQQWDVAYTPDLQAEQPQTAPIGTFLVSSENVLFQWRQPFAESELRRQLKNCILVIEADNQFAHIALRPPISSELIKLDLSRDKQLQEFLLPDLPKKSRIFAEIQGDGFPVETTGGVLSQTIPVGPDEEKKFDQLPGAELGLKLTTDGNGLNLTVAPRFREKGSLIPLSRPKLGATKKATEQAIVRANAEIKEESQKISAYQKQIRTLPSAPAGSPAAVARGITLNKLEQSIKRASNRMSSLQRQIPALEARMKAVPDVEAFMDRLDGRQLSVQIYADCGDYRLSLVVAGPAEANGANGQSFHKAALTTDRQMAMTVTQ